MDGELKRLAHYYYIMFVHAIFYPLISLVFYKLELYRLLKNVVVLLANLLSLCSSQ
ncbi:hypothetical protein IC575_002091 [Cucumis melo]